jgi:hypothetical protein
MIFMAKPSPEKPVVAGDPLKRDELCAFLREQFSMLGFAPDDALWLSEKRADWHEAERLIQGGCPPNVAARILAPID